MTCPECKGTKTYTCPLTAKVSPCSLCSIESEHAETPEDALDALCQMSWLDIFASLGYDKDDSARLAAVAEVDGEDNALAYELTTGGYYGYGNVVEVGNREYVVMDDEQADSARDEALDSYLDDGCVEGADSPYFDREAWKSDARHDGRGHILSSWDGTEYEHQINGEYLYVYRIN